MRFKIKNELKKIDYERLADFLKDDPSISIEFFPGVDLGFVSVSPVIIAVEGFGYKIDAKILFEQPIGFEVHGDLKLDDDMHGSIAVNRGNLRLSKIVAETTDLERNMNMILKTIESIVNHVCIRFDKLVEQVFALNSEWLDGRLSVIFEREELKRSNHRHHHNSFFFRSRDFRSHHLHIHNLQ